MYIVPLNIPMAFQNLLNVRASNFRTFSNKNCILVNNSLLKKFFFKKRQIFLKVLVVPTWYYHYGIV